MLRPTLCLIVMLLSTVNLRAEKRPSEQSLNFFETKIRPVLIEHCYRCHSPKKGKKPKGGLDLTNRESILRGGESGPALIPGKPEKSLLIKALRYQSLEMPPKGKLSERVTQHFAKWIQQGAPHPGTAKSPLVTKKKRDSKLWSFQPITPHQPPKINGVDHPIDRFIRSRLQTTKLPSASLAEPRILIRRLYLDLIGLPPDPKQVIAFEKACAKDRKSAVESVVDQLLKPPDFGDRWASHWLDLTAYADTIGLGRAIPALEAWRYRDYVIDAFNSDKSYKEFIRQQIAGDIYIPPVPQAPAGKHPTSEDIIATGFLALGPWELVSGDKAQLRMDVIDRQVNRVGQTFLGLTMGCARCHDHKFDPISQADYYALAGLFKSTITLNGRIGGVFSAINHVSLPESPEELLARAERVRAYQKEVAKAKKSKNRGRLGVLKYIKPHRTQAQAGAVIDAPEPEDCHITIRGNAHILGKKVPRGFPSAIAPKDKPRFTRGGSGRVQLAQWIADPRNPLTARVWVNRVWHHLFGAGIVRSVDNFGMRGEKPSHPKLLDHLASEFMKDGWSTKRLIRRIVLSQTWQQSSTNRSALAKGASQLDPENRLLWRANRRRLEAEAIRDAMLAVSGRLIQKRGGPTLPLDHPGNLSTALTGSLRPNAKFSEELTRRRSIYQPQKRKSPFDALGILAVLDLPDLNEETGRRAVTTVPTQALSLMSSPFVRQCAKALAKRCLDSSVEAGARVKTLFQLAYGRPPSRTEESESLAFLRDLRSDSESESWSRLCQALLISNEFLFRD
mgnify:CR=1 FL=1